MARDYALLDITGHGAYRCGQDLGDFLGRIKFVRVDTCGADQRYVDHPLCHDLICVLCVLCCRHLLPSFLRVVTDNPKQGPLPHSCARIGDTGDRYGVNRNILISGKIRGDDSANSEA